MINIADKKRIDEVGAYIEKFYVPDNDDIKLDKEMRTNVSWHTIMEFIRDLYQTAFSDKFKADFL